MVHALSPHSQVARFKMVNGRLVKTRSDLENSKASDLVNGVGDGKGGKQKGGQAETVASLEAKLKIIAEEREVITAQVAATEKRLAELDAGASAGQEGEVDALDSYVTTEERKDLNTTLRNARQELSRMDKDQTRFEKLLKIARPAIAGLESAEEKAQKVRLAALNAQRAAERSRREGEGSPGASGKSDPQGAKVPASGVSSALLSPVDASSQSTLHDVGAAAERAQVQPPSEPADSSSAPSSTSQQPARPATAPTASTPVAALELRPGLQHLPKAAPAVTVPAPAPAAAASDIPSRRDASRVVKRPATQSESVRGPKRQKAVAAPAIVPDDDTEEATWLPPVGQTGDGKTALNDKLGY